MPHGFCFSWQPGVLWLNVISDALIALAYFSIPITLVYFVHKRKDLEFNWIFIYFAVFIIACGTTHLVEIWNIWFPAYWLAGILKAFTALASISTAYLLVRLLPKLLLIPSPSALKAVNEQLMFEVTERKQTEQTLNNKNILLEEASLALKLSEERFRSSFETAAIGMALVGTDGSWLKVNQALCDMLGMSESYLLSRTFQDITHPDDLDADLHLFNALLNDKKDNYQMEKRYFHSDGRIIWINLSVSILRNADRQPIHFVSQIEDITERKLQEKNIAHHANHDSLTQLPNRRIVMDRLNQAMLRAKRNKHGMALLFIDIDYFKNINDSFGHDFGDDVLKLISNKLQTYIRSTDTLGRLGGDEFLIVLSEIKTMQSALKIANNILEGVQTPLLIQGIDIKVGLSIGVAIFEPDSKDTLAELIKKADIALYDVKASGRNAVKVYQDL